MSALPLVVRKHRICVICEGNEDYLYFKRLIDLNLWSTSYSFTPVNAKGASNIGYFIEYMYHHKADREKQIQHSICSRRLYLLYVIERSLILLTYR